MDAATKEWQRAFFRKNGIGVQRRQEWIQNIENQLPWIDQPKTESKNESSLYN
jgi:hypothetical protein